MIDYFSCIQSNHRIAWRCDYSSKSKICVYNYFYTFSFKVAGTSYCIRERIKTRNFSHDCPNHSRPTKLGPIWKDRYIFINSKIRLMRSLEMVIFLYACETWTLNAELEKKEYKLWKWDASEESWASPTKTELHSLK